MIVIPLLAGLVIYYYLNVKTGAEFEAASMNNQMLSNADIGPVKLRGDLQKYGRDPFSRAQPIVINNQEWTNQIDHKVRDSFWADKKWVKSMQQELYNRSHHYYTVSYQKNILQTPTFGSPLPLSISTSFPSYIDG